MSLCKQDDGREDSREISAKEIKKGMSKNRRPNINQSSLYTKWKGSLHSIYTQYQALALISDGPELKVEAIHRADSVLLLIDAARCALSKEEFRDFQSDLRTNFGEGDSGLPRYCNDNDARLSLYLYADVWFMLSARIFRS